MPIHEDTGEPDYARATPERTREYLYNEAGLEADEADAYVENNAEQAREELDKAKNSKPKMEKGKTLTQFLSEKAAWQQQMDEAQRNVDYWEGVKNAGQETAPGMDPAQDATNGTAPVDSGNAAQNIGQTAAPASGNAVDAGEQRASLRSKRTSNKKHDPSTAGNKTDSNTSPIGKGFFGKIYDNFRGKAKEAFEFLVSNGSGDLTGVFHREGFGDIDVVFGDETGRLKSPGKNWNIM